MTIPRAVAARRLGIVSLALGWLIRCAAPATPIADTPATPTPAPRWNVLFVVVDDLNARLGTFGHPLVKTPNVDRIAARGVRLDRAYSQFPICNPSRGSFLSGLRPDTTRILDGGTPFRAAMPSVVSLPQFFQQNGYFAARVGKVFHDGPGMDDTKEWDVAINTRGTPQGRRGEGRSLKGGSLPCCDWLAAEGADEDQADGQSAIEAVRLIEEARLQPFFIAVGFHKPHDPFVAPKKYFDLYPLDRIQAPTDPPDDRADIPPAALPRWEFPFSEMEQRELIRAYYASISFVDAQVGKLLDALDRGGALDETVVVFFGDHGHHLGDHGIWGKDTLFEHSARVPLVIAAPGIRGRGQASGRPVELVDLYPTLADLCGLTAPGDLEGTSLRRLLDDPARSWKAAAFIQKGTRGRSIRTERWRYTEWDGGAAGLELYDHDADPQEYRNLASDPRYASVAEELKRQLRAGWREAVPK